jgi:hypothetical protein
MGSGRNERRSLSCYHVVSLRRICHHERNRDGVRADPSQEDRLLENGRGMDLPVKYNKRAERKIVRALRLAWRMELINDRKSARRHSYWVRSATRWFKRIAECDGGIYPGCQLEFRG